MDQPAVPRPSGLPKPATSRLPVLRSSVSHSQLRTPSSTEQLRKKTSVSSLSRASLAAPAPALAPKPTPAPAQQRISTLQKKSSRVSLAPTNAPHTAISATPNTRRRASGIPSAGPTRTNDAPVFKRPFARQPSFQTKPAPQPASKPDVRKEDDALGSLDGFRSASRASSRAESRTGFRESDNDLEPEQAEHSKGKQQLSLSDRTIESLAHLPSSPAGRKGRRRSSFYGVDDGMPPPLRPASALSSSNSRPTSSDGASLAPPVTPHKYGALPGRLAMTAPGKRSVSALVPMSTATPSRTSSVSRPVSTVKKQPPSLAQNLQTTPKPRPLSNSKSMVARTPKSRPSLAGTFGQAISPPSATIASPVAPSPSRDAPLTSRKVTSSSNTLREQLAKAKAVRKADATKPSESPVKPGGSSNALREQIAKAREAARKAKVEPMRTSTPPRDAIVPDPAEVAEFDFGLDDPFNQTAKGTKSLMKKRIDGARVDGRLNIAVMGLKDIPDEVLNMYTYDPSDTSVAWGEVMDLATIIAADNELANIPESMFPDVDVEDVIDSDEAGPQFGGVQSLDFHGNVLRELPMGMRRLTQLSKLNLSRNQLPMEAFDVISQIATLRELKLAENALQGDLPSVLGNMSQLEVLELQNNKLTSLPAEIRQLTHLRTLNVAENQLETVPMDLFTATPLTELFASKNRFSGYFFTIDAAEHLQHLQLSMNSLTSLSKSDIVRLPALKHLDVTANRLVGFPSVTSWTKLATLLVGDNKLKVFPEGFCSLQQLRVADFTGNDLTKLEEEIALMQSLKTLTIAANPLRERKYLTMNTEDIQRDLASRLQPAMDEAVEFEDGEGVAADGTTSDSKDGWQMTPAGTLDLSSKQLTEFSDEATLKTFAESNEVRQLLLQQNALEFIPSTLFHLTHLTVLDLSKNNIENALAAPLELPKLRDLRLAGNKLKTLITLMRHLTAPALQNLDISQNRLSGSLPPLRTYFPELILLVAADNSFSEVTAESLQGLKMANLSNNDIERLEPRIGLLQGTLNGLNVEGNKFRVPNYQVLQKGTDSVLTWLRDKIPRESWDSSHTEFFDADDGMKF
ncbi:L domain-like protein [Dothidotthia symphoricarpi CBS 119687]|uniref:L domain-like protein n=1 Tax=Dothidotthia symphoricarpi CBS 119687 TaxID=1392245 RepID=A0A6A6AQK2_9PLEO|nr:L domain-like protein [Dothidotthia symphoricarpi CBS 119687]KAF2133448.1 L domain-like protein [Dothidotthia symphoricarpi CBS 119687]